jgi:hypothetical protein
MVYAWRTILFEGRRDEMYEAVYYYNLHERDVGNAQEFVTRGVPPNIFTSTMITTFTQFEGYAVIQRRTPNHWAFAEVRSP